MNPSAVLVVNRLSAQSQKKGSAHSNCLVLVLICHAVRRNQGTRNVDQFLSLDHNWDFPAFGSRQFLWALSVRFYADMFELKAGGCVLAMCWLCL
jgi:hypothetical protein